MSTMRYWVIRRAADGREEVLAGPISGLKEADKALAKAHAAGHKQASMRAEFDATGEQGDADDDGPPDPGVVRHALR